MASAGIAGCIVTLLIAWSVWPANIVTAARAASTTANTTANISGGRWQAFENKSDCSVWNPAPKPNTVASWTGSCADGKANGLGRLVWTYVEAGAVRTQIYEGDMRAGMLHGRGAYVGPGGERYDGDWVNSKSTGQGILVLPNGDRYERDFVNANRTGRGVYQWSNGNHYEGDLLDNKMHGQGIFT